MDHEDQRALALHGGPQAGAARVDHPEFGHERLL
jgi:hypothetical protein